MVKYILKYADGKNPSVYTDRIMYDITTRLKKKKLYGDMIFLPTE
jgi:hypothetical protein